MGLHKSIIHNSKLEEIGEIEVDFHKNDFIKEWYEELEISNCKNKIPRLSSDGLYMVGLSKKKCIDPIFYILLPNNMYDGIRETFILSGLNTSVSLSPINMKYFEEGCCIFTISKCGISKWYTNDLPLFKPDIHNINYEEFKKDSVIYTCFHTSSNNCTSVSLTHNNEIYDIRNEFFFMTKDEFLSIKNLSTKLAIDCENDKNKKNKGEFDDSKINNDGEKFAALWIQENEDTLSIEAKNLLDLGRQLIIETIQDRKMMNEKFQLERWDAGFTQIKKGILEDSNIKKQEKYKELYEEFKKNRNILKTKCQNMAEDLGCWWKINLY